MAAPTPAAPSGHQFALRHGEQRVVVVEVGGGLRSYSLADRELLDGYTEHQMCPSARGEVLIPWPNRLRDGSYEFDGHHLQVPLSEPGKRNAIHGLVRWVNWNATEHTESQVVMEHTLAPQDGYPFSLALRIDYHLDDDGLTVQTTATRSQASSCPTRKRANVVSPLPEGVETTHVALLGLEVVRGATSGRCRSAGRAAPRGPGCTSLLLTARSRRCPPKR